VLKGEPLYGKVLEELVKAGREVRSENPMWTRRAAMLEKAVAMKLIPSILEESGARTEG